MSPELPSWVPVVDRALARAAREVRLLGAATPIAAQAERRRVTQAFEAGGEARPRWSYRPSAPDAALRLLAEARRTLVFAGGSPLATLYDERARELELEAELSALVGTAALGVRAGERFRGGVALAREASALACAWLAAPPLRDSCAREPGIVSDATDPRSLLSRMREEVRRHDLPFTVIPQPDLAPLAATGDAAILVAEGRLLSAVDTERTVFHEIEGHARPRARASSCALGLFAFGSARGADDQEGRALVLEEQRGFLDVPRKRQLAARHRAVDLMRDGATFVDAARALIRDYDLAPSAAVLAAERAFRGGDGEHAGLGREHVYLTSFLAVGAWLKEHPDDERVLSRGRIALAALDGVRAYA